MDMREDMRNRDMRYMGDGRNPYGRRGGYARNVRGGRGRSRRMAMMDYAGYPDMRGMEHNGVYRENRRGGDMNVYQPPYYNMDNGDMRGMDGHHYPQSQGSTYYPIQAMGTFEGYYGMPNQDHARRDRGMDYGYPMGMPYPHYPPMDYGYPYGDFGETLSEKELEHWKHKLMSQLDEQEKQMFSKEMISQKAKQMNLTMHGFGEKELELATIMVYTDYKRTIGKNPDMAIKLAYDWLTDEDVAVKGAEKLAVYYDCIVEGEDD